MFKNATLDELAEPAGQRIYGLVALLRKHRSWLLIVLLPVILTAVYLYGIAANQYESEAHFLVRSSRPSMPIPGAAGQALSLVGGLATTAKDAVSVNDYLDSHDTVGSLQRRMNLVSIFRRPEADLFSRLRLSDPSPEALLSYYRKHVDIDVDGETGVSRIRARAFRPADAQAIAGELLRLGEARVNSLNQRAYATKLASALANLADAEAALSASRGSLTRVREAREDIDPKATGKAQLELVTKMQAQLASLRAQEAAAASTIGATSPQLVATRAQINALQAQLDNQLATLTGDRRSIASGLGEYQGLELRQQFLVKQYNAAATSLERARERANSQELFVVRVVNPSLPEQAAYPRRARILLIVFGALLLTYGVGQLLVKEVYDHVN